MYMQEDDSMSYQCVYPDVYYKVQPFVMMACDEMESHGGEMLTRDMVRHISDQIYEDVCRVHPDLAERADHRGMSYEAASAYGIRSTFAEAQLFDRGGFFRDLLDIVLLNEIFRRRRRY